MAREHGSQCGFCTPGFVMSLFGLYKNAYRPARESVVEVLSGNLCRCTGYRPILAAADTMYALPAPADWRGPGIAPDGTRCISFDEETLAAQLAALGRETTFEYAHAGQVFFAPRTIDALAALVAARPDARIVAGATDVGLWVTKQHRALGDLVYIGNVDALARMVETDDVLEIGAAATLAEAFAALERDWPELHEAWDRFASVPIRNSGTLGGNVANGSPIGDSMPVLIALGATVVLRQDAAVRTLPLEDFYVGYQKSARMPGEFVAGIRVPRRRAGTVLRAYKLSRRYDQDISAAFACFRLDLDGARIAASRIGVGGVAATPRRAVASEAALAGRPWNEATARAAMAVLARRVRADHRHARDRGVPAGRARGAAAAVLARDRHRRAPRAHAGVRSHRVTGLPR